MKKIIFALILSITANVFSARIHDFVILGDLQAVLTEIAYGVPVDLEDDFGQTALMIAAAEDKTGNIIQELINRGANKDKPDCNGETPLMLAVESENFVGAKILLQNNANINATDNNGDSVLFWAIELKKDDIFNLILEYNPNLFLTNKDGESLLMKTACLGYNERIEKIVDKLSICPPTLQHYVNLKDKTGTTALLYAIENKNAGGALRLLEHYADPNIADEDGKTPLMEAAQQDFYYNIIEILYKYGARIHTQDKRNYNALGYAWIAFNEQRLRNWENINRLSRLGAD